MATYLCMWFAIFTCLWTQHISIGMFRNEEKISNAHTYTYTYIRNICAFCEIYSKSKRIKTRYIFHYHDIRFSSIFVCFIQAISFGFCCCFFLASAIALQTAHGLFQLNARAVKCVKGANFVWPLYNSIGLARSNAIGKCEKWFAPLRKSRRRSHTQNIPAVHFLWLNVNDFGV